MFIIQTMPNYKKISNVKLQDTKYSNTLVYSLFIILFHTSRITPLKMKHVLSDTSHNFNYRLLGK